MTIAKGEEVWGNRVKSGSTLYLCFEDSRLRIQNRLFDITEYAPSNVYFCEESCMLGGELEKRIEQFVTDHADTVLIIIDTLQMIRKPTTDNSYANDYADLTILKKLADKYSIAILLIHHLRKEKDSDPFNRISGTTGLSGAVDSSFTLVEDKRGSGKALLSCIGRDIEYREIQLRRNEDNIWEVMPDSFENPDVLLDDIVFLIPDFMRDKPHYIGTPAELAELVSREKKISAKYISRQLVQNAEELLVRGIRFETRRSNGKRLIELFAESVSGDDSDDRTDTVLTPSAVDPIGTESEETCK